MKSITRFFHYLLIPSERNNYRAKLIQHDLLSLYLCIILLLTIAIRQSNHLGRIGSVLGIATDINATRLLEYTNSERIKNHLQPLILNTKLSTAAEKKAENMFAENYWAHFSPEGKSPWDFITAQNYQYEYAGENLAKNFLFSQNVVDAWMNSPTHRENLLRPEFTEVGFAVKNGVLNGEETTLVVQEFGKPLAGTETAPEPVQPVAAVPPAKAPGKVLAQVKQITPQTSVPVINFVYIFLGILTIVFGIDFYIATKLRVIRLHGNSIAHMAFLLIIGAGFVLFLTKGTIL